MNRPKVYITQETNHNFTAAEEFGDIEFLCADDFRNIKDSVHNERLISDASSKLRKFDEERDWIVITGSPYVASILFMVLGHRGVRRVNMLRWDNRNMRYVPLHINLRQGAI